jgi:hypothetical protein
VFNADGSSGESLWSLQGNTWLAATSTTLPDGTSSTATQVWKFTDKDTILWKSIDGEFDGMPTPDFEVTLKRKSSGK